jgi:exosome complex component RRP42
MDIVPEITKRSIAKLINEGERPDGRAMDEYRDVFVEPNFITKAEGSARVKLGDTQVIAGIKPTIGSPFPDTPDVGVLMTNCEMLPMASPDFEPGPPSPDSVELARVVDRGIRESQLVDLEKLCIKEGEKVWMLFIDLHILDYDGNLFDACNLAVMSALMNCKLPSVTLVDDEVVIDEDNLVPLSINDRLSLSTFVKIGNGLVLDPNLEEERILDARLTIGTSENGNCVCSMQKGGSEPLTRDDILNAVHTAFEVKDSLLENL